MLKSIENAMRDTVEHYCPHMTVVQSKEMGLPEPGFVVIDRAAGLSVFVSLRLVAHADDREVTPEDAS